MTPFQERNPSRDYLPRLGGRLLELFLSPEHDAVIGDISERYVDESDRNGALRSGIWFWGQFARTVPAILFHDVIWNSLMYKNYLITSVRQISKHRVFSAINILGLAMSMSVCLLILALIDDQGSYDSFHPDADRTYRLTTTEEQSFGVISVATSSGPIGVELARELPGIEQVVRFRRTAGPISTSEQAAKFAGLYADAGFFEMFDFPLMFGDKKTALENPRSIVLTAELADILFGEIDPTGETVTRGEMGEFSVTGVFETLPAQTHLSFEALISFETLVSLSASGSNLQLDDWNTQTQYYNYLRLSPDTDVGLVEETANAMGARFHKDETLAAPLYALQSISSVNLGRDLSNQMGSILPSALVYVLSIYALLLMGVAIVNYVTLSASRAIKRAREIGVRKVMGASRGQIIKQLVSESMILALIALILAGLLFNWLGMQFSGLSFADEHSISIGLDTIDLSLLGKFFGFTIIVGVLAGIFPAVNMSRFSPARVLSGLGKIKGLRRLSGRKILVVSQFTLSILALVITIVLFKQTSYLLEADYGFDEEQLVHIDLDGVDYPTFRTKLMQVAGIAEVAATSTIPNGGGSTSTTFQTSEMERPEVVQYFSIDEQFLAQYRTRVLSGRNFQYDQGSDEENSILISEAAVSFFDFDSAEEAVGEQLTFDAGYRDRTVTVVGVVENMYSRGFEEGYVPVAYVLDPELYNHAAVRVIPTDIRASLDGLEKAWKTLAPTLPINYAFFDDQIQASYESFNDSIRILGLFAFLLIFIACLGLVGMASYTVETRTREVGIRKVLGARARDVVGLLSREYVVLVIWAVAIAGPVSWILSSLVLRNFANSISMTVWILALGTLPIMVLALTAIGSQTYRAAATNPVETIKQD